MRKITLLSFGVVLLVGALMWVPPAHARGKDDGSVENERADRGPGILERLLQREGEDADEGRHGRVEKNGDADEGGGGRRGRDSDDDDDGQRRGHGRRGGDED